MKILIWLSILCLDAPLVALLWHRLYALAFKFSVPWQLELSLFMAVWGIYLLDRFMDGRRPPEKPSDSAPRHLVAREHPVLFAGSAFLSGCCSFFFALRLLPELSFMIALALSAIVCLHLFLSAKWQRYPKEVVCGVVFAAGVAVPMIGFAPVLQIPTLVAMLLPFAGLCIANCWAVSRYEKDLTSSRMLYGIYLVLLLAASFYGLFQFISTGNRLIFSSSIAAILLLACLEYCWQRTHSRGLNYAPDLVLMTTALLGISLITLKSI